VVEGQHRDFLEEFLIPKESKEEVEIILQEAT